MADANSTNPVRLSRSKVIAWLQIMPRRLSLLGLLGLVGLAGFLDPLLFGLSSLSYISYIANMRFMSLLVQPDREICPAHLPILLFSQLPILVVFMVGNRLPGGFGFLGFVGYVGLTVQTRARGLRRPPREGG